MLPKSSEQYQLFGKSNWASSRSDKKKEVQTFFSTTFDPNKPGHLYDDGNRVIDENITIANDNELKEKLSEEREWPKMEIYNKERQYRKEGRQITFEARNSMDACVDQLLFAPHLKKSSGRSKRRIIHFDGSKHQKQGIYSSI